MPNIVPRNEELAGQIIDDGRLLLVDPLGRGSGGVVFRAIDLCSSTPYAVKCMTKAEHGSRQAAFQQREIHLHRKVSPHMNVVTLHRVVEEDGYIFLVLDYCSGGDLFKFLTRRGTYIRNDELIKNVMCQLIDGVEHCHKRGVFHRDIKPENIMCSKDGMQLKLGDFGLATDSVASRNFGAGTSGYMSPECIGHEMGVPGYQPAANDVWALGIIFTSMISGHNPWRRAVMDDPCFEAYIMDPKFLKHMLPISAAASDILVGIFAPSEVRISLPDLRAKVCAAHTFFLSDKEIARANRFVRQAAESYVAGISSGSGDSVSSFDALFDVEPANAAQRLIEANKVVDVEGAAHTAEVAVAAEPQLGVSETGVRLEMRKRPPPPQPMPSFRDFMRTSSSASSHLDVRDQKAKPWRSHSPTGLFKRIMDKIFD